MNVVIEKKFNEIYDETYNHILRFVISKCDNLNNVEDIMQNIYIKLYNVMEKNIGINNCKAFLIKLSRNELFKYYSLKNKLKVLINGDIFDDNIGTPIVEEIKDECFDIEEDFLIKFEVERIWNEIQKEDITTQKILTLYFLEELKISDISRILEMNESSIKNRLYRSIKRIKNKLKEGEYNE